MTAATLISLLRLGLAPLVALAILGGRRDLALMVLAGAMVSDLADGPVARRAGTASEAGARLDVLADGAVLIGAAVALAAAGAWPAWVPLVLVLMLAQFVAGWRAGRVTYDPVGRWFGAITYLVVLVTLLLPDDAVGTSAAWTLASVAGLSLWSRRRWRRASRPWSRSPSA